MEIMGEHPVMTVGGQSMEGYWTMIETCTPDPFPAMQKSISGEWRTTEDTIYTGKAVSMMIIFVEFLPARQLIYTSQAYLLPNDDKENERLDIHHALVMTIMDERLFLAPVKNPTKVIDLCTGSGIWAVEFGISLLK